MASLCHTTEFNHIEAAFSEFGLGDPTWSDLESLREFALCQSCGSTQGDELVPEEPIGAGVSGLLHCSQYGNTLRCSQMGSID